MPNLRGKTWTTTTPANVGDAQYWEDHLISDEAAQKAAGAVQSVNNTLPDENGNINITPSPLGPTVVDSLNSTSATDALSANQGHALKDLVDTKQNTLTFDNVPTNGSNNPVKSGGIYDALAPKVSESLLKATVGWTGKNLLENTASSRTVNGVAVTVNADGSITLNGTHTASASDFQVRTHVEDVIANGMIISGVPSGASNVKLRISLNQSPWTNFAVDTGSGATISGYSSQTNVNCNLTLVGNGTVYNNVTVYPMLRDASITDDTYEPYHESVEEVVEQIYADNGVLGAKNLLPNNATSQTISGITYTVNADGSITSNGTATTWASLVLCTNLLLKKGKYILTGIPNVNGAFITILKSSGDISCQFGNSIRYFELASDEVLTQVRISYRANTTVTDEIFYPMLRLASDPDDTYVPYAMTNRELTDNKFDRAEQRMLGAKNLLPNNATSQTKNGITFTVNADGSVTVNGTATANAELIVSYDIPYLHGGKYILSGCPSGGADNKYRITAYRIDSTDGQSGSLFDIGEGLEFTYKNQTGNARFIIYIESGQTVNNLTFYPMLRLASDPDDTYVPYAMTNRELTEEKLSISELKTIASSAADFAAFKTAIANL